MVKFKIYNKKLKQFVSQDASDKVWKARYNLGIWNNSIHDNKLEEMYKIMKRSDKDLELYVKLNGRFQPVTKEVIDIIVKDNKKRNKSTKKKYKKRNRSSLKKNKTKNKTKKK